MGNFDQTKRIKNIRGIIEREISTKEDILMQVQDCYLGYLDITIHYKKEQKTVLSPIAEGILSMFKNSAPLKILDLGDLFCVDKAVILQALQQLQRTHTLTLSHDEQIIELKEAEQPYVIYAESIVINPTMLKKVDFELDYTIPEKMIVVNDHQLTDEDVYKLFPQLKHVQLLHWVSQSVAGPTMYKATIYNQVEKVQRVVLYNEDGQQLYEVERTMIDLSNVLLEQKEPDLIVPYNESMESLQSDVKWIVSVNDMVPDEVVSFIEQLKLPMLLLLGENVGDDELKTFDLLEKQSKGLLTVIQVPVAFDLIFVSEKMVLKQLSEKQMALYKDKLFIASKQEQLQVALVELAKESNHPSAMKVFIYLVEQKTDSETLREIVQHLVSTSTSERLIQRGKILDNHGYNNLAKEVYELGIIVHAREVNL